VCLVSKHVASYIRTTVYITMVKFSINACASSFLVMKDTGPTLHSLMLDAGFKDFWSRLAVREAFFQHVGQSALNLETLNLCHNDIRPPNITVKDDRFCLIDFDNCRQSPVFKNSPVMKSLGVESNSKRMMFSVAQIGIVVFKISMLNEEHGNVFRQVNQWLQGKGQEIPDKFETWVRAKSIEMVLLPETRVGGETYDIAFMEAMLL
jgi:serine/threonine protein kinase